MPDKKMFDAFLYIRPVQNDSTSPKFNDAQVLWNYPSDISAITRDLRDTSQFCFPDLEVIKIEHSESTRCEHFISTLTSSDGSRIYAICMRIMPQGQRRRYDLKRRAKDCLCIITKHAYFSMFRVLLLQIHALSMLSVESSCTAASMAPSIANNLLAQVFHSSVPPRGESLIIRRNAELNMSADLNLFIPRHGGLLRKEVLIRPLLEALGVERFLLILSALLCERRIIFISHNIDTLAEAVHAANAMLYPFTWQHVFVPVLPSKLLSYAAAPMPFIIGVRKYLYARLTKEALEDMIIVDLENGECDVLGQSVVRDIVGSAASVQAPTMTNAMKQQASEGLKQASEGFDRFRNVAAKILLGGSSSGSNASGINTSTSSTNNSSSKVESEAGKDLMSILVSELRGALARKPGPPGSSGGINNLVRMGLTGSRSAADISHDRWASECERTLRECLLFFFVYLFYDLEPRPATSSICTTPQYECNNALPTVSGSGNTNSSSGSGYADINSLSTRKISTSSQNGNDFDDFIFRLQERGETKDITEFLSEVMHSQMFEQFRGERAARRGFGPKSPKDGSGNSNSGGSGTAGSEGGFSHGLGKSVERSSIDKDFEMGCAEVRAKPYPVPPMTVKLIVSQLLTRIDASLVLPTNAQQAQAAGFDVAEAIKAAESDFHPIALQLTSNTSAFTLREELGMMEKLCVQCSSSQHFPRIMRTIWFRLEDCKGPNWKHGHKALQLLKTLLLRGPEIVLAETLNQIELLRSITRQGPSQSITLNFGTELDLRPDAYDVLFLVLDHHRLLLRRKYSTLLAAGAFPHLSLVPQRKELLIRNGQTALMLPDFKALHHSFGQKLPPGSVPRLPEEVTVNSKVTTGDSVPVTSKPTRPMPIKRGGITQQKLAVTPSGELDLFNDASTDFNSLFKDVNITTSTAPAASNTFPTSNIFDSFSVSDNIFNSNSGPDPFGGNNSNATSLFPSAESFSFPASFASTTTTPIAATGTPISSVSHSSFQPITGDPWGNPVPVPVPSTSVAASISGWDHTIMSSDVWGGGNSTNTTSSTKTTPITFQEGIRDTPTPLQPLPATDFVATSAPQFPPLPSISSSISKNDSHRRTSSANYLSVNSSGVAGVFAGSEGTNTSTNVTAFSADPFAADPFASYNNNNNSSSSSNNMLSASSGFAPDPFFGMVIPKVATNTTTTTSSSTSASSVEISKEFTPWTLDCDWPTIPPEPTITFEDLLPRKPPKPTTHSYGSYGYQPTNAITPQVASYSNYNSSTGTGTTSGSNMTYLVQKKAPVDPFADLVKIKK